MLSEDKIENNEILGSLEELGLSKYESSAYYNLLGKGMISATEIAYSSNIPRTKIYFVLKQLEKKKLVLINNQKPLTFRAVSPNEAFNEIITKYENKLKCLKKIICNLQQINDDGFEKKGIEEKKYFVLNQFSTNNKLKELIKNTKESIDITINQWGNNLLIFYKEQIMQAIFRGVKIRIVFDSKNERNDKILLNAIDMRVSKIRNNMFIFDNYYVLIMDDTGTGSTLIQSDEIFISVMTNHFKDIWNLGEIRIIENNKLKS